MLIQASTTADSVVNDEKSIFSSRLCFPPPSPSFRLACYFAVAVPYFFFFYAIKCERYPDIKGLSLFSFATHSIALFAR